MSKKYFVNMNDDDLYKLQHLSKRNKIITVSGVNKFGKDFVTRGVPIMRYSKGFSGEVLDASGFDLMIGDRVVHFSFGFDYDKINLTVLNIYDPSPTGFVWDNPHKNGISRFADQIEIYQKLEKEKEVGYTLSRYYNQSKNLEVLQNALAGVVEIRMEDEKPKIGVLLDYYDFPEQNLTHIVLETKNKIQEETLSGKDVVKSVDLLKDMQDDQEL